MSNPDPAATLRALLEKWKERGDMLCRAHLFVDELEAALAASRATMHYSASPARETPDLRLELIAKWRANADMLAEGNKAEHTDPAVAMQRACADDLEAGLNASLAQERKTS